MLDYAVDSKSFCAGIAIPASSSETTLNSEWLLNGLSIPVQSIAQLEGFVNTLVMPTTRPKLEKHGHMNSMRPTGLLAPTETHAWAYR